LEGRGFNPAITDGARSASFAPVLSQHVVAVPSDASAIREAARRSCVTLPRFAAF